VLLLCHFFPPPRRGRQSTRSDTRVPRQGPAILHGRKAHACWARSVLHGRKAHACSPKSVLHGTPAGWVALLCEPGYSIVGGCGHLLCDAAAARALDRVAVGGAPVLLLSPSGRPGQEPLSLAGGSRRGTWGRVVVRFAQCLCPGRGLLCSGLPSGSARNVL